MHPGETVHTGAPKPAGEKLQVLSSNAGYYLGYLEDGMPYSRETVYFRTETEAEDVLDRWNNSYTQEREQLVREYWRY